MTPAPTQYKPDKFLKYDKKTKLQPHRANFNNEAKLKDADEYRSTLGPGQYNAVKLNQKKKPAFQIATAERNLLKNEKTGLPGPLSYDITTGLSMCSSTAHMVYNPNLDKS